MLRRVSRSSSLAFVLALVTTVLVAPSTAGAQGDLPTDTAAPIPPPKASIVVDVDTGEVITASNEREPLPPASTTKMLTALLVRDRLAQDASIGISGTAAVAPPRRIGMEYGSTWGVEGLMYAMMHCSCNDAAWALGQAAGGGTMPGFEAQMKILAEKLGLEDDPVLRDPAGLDDDRSIETGNRLSARDLAIAGRAYLDDPVLAEIATAPGHEWIGGDDEPHSVTNLNAFLGAYPGAIGVKTGYTSRAGLTFVGAATRDGRTLLVVVLGSDNHYAHARELLDAGFMLASVEEKTGDTLPAVAEDLATQGTTTTTTTTTTVPASSSDQTDDAAALGGVGGGPSERGSSSSGAPVLALVAAALAVGLILLVVVLARRQERSQGIDLRPVRPSRKERRRRAEASSRQQ